MRMRRPQPFFIAMVAGLLLILIIVLMADHAKTEDAWILCNPNSYVCVRAKPSGRGEIIGRFDAGDKIEVTDKKKNGFIKCINLSLEQEEGWICYGYVVYDEPYVPHFTETYIKSEGRVAARKTVNGDRRCWLKNNAKIKVYLASDEWCITNKGYIKTEFVELGR